MQIEKKIATILDNWDEEGLRIFIKQFKKIDSEEYTNEYEKAGLAAPVADEFYKEALLYLERYECFLQPVLPLINNKCSNTSPVIYIPFCGPGIEAMVLANKYPQVKIIAFDVSEDMIKFANNFSEKFSDSCKNRVQFLHHSANEIDKLFGLFGRPEVILARRGLHRLGLRELKELLGIICDSLSRDGFFYSISLIKGQENQEALVKEMKTRFRNCKKEFLPLAVSFLYASLNAPSFGEYINLFNSCDLNESLDVKRTALDIEFLYLKAEKQYSKNSLNVQVEMCLEDLK